MRDRVFILLFFYWVLLGSSLFGNNNLNQFSLKHITTRMGLSQANPTAIFCDFQGYMWFGTEDGLNKYNGYDFTIYRHDQSDSTSLSSSWILDIFEDQQNNLWIRTQNGIDIYNRGEDNFSRITVPVNEYSLIGNNIIRYYKIGLQGILWCGASNGLYSYNIRTKKIDDLFINYKNRELLDDLFIQSVDEDASGNIWISDLKGCFKIDISKKEIEKIELPDKNGKLGTDIPIVQVLHRPNGTTWIISASDGILILDKNNKLYRHLTDKNCNLTSIVLVFADFDNEGNLWVGSTDFGVDFLSADNLKNNNFNFSKISNQEYGTSALLTDIITGYYFDKQGRIWIGSRFGGINYLDQGKKRFTHLYLIPGYELSLSQNNITDIVENDKGEIFIASDGGGIDVLSEDRSKTTPFSEYCSFGKLTNNKVLSLAFDNNGKLYVGMWQGGIDIFDFQTKTKSSISMGESDTQLTSNNVFSLFIDSNDNIWIGLWHGGLNKFDPVSKKITRFKINPILEQSGEIRNFFEDSDHNLWFASHPSGLYCFDFQTGSLISYTNDPNDPNSINSNIVQCIFEDSSGRIWIGAYEGLCLFDKKEKTFRTFTITDGLPNNIIYGIQEASDGEIWVSTNYGLSQVVINQVNDSVSLSFRNFDINDGLQDNQFNLWADYRSSKGELFFGGVNGVNYFNPEQIIRNVSPPSVVFTGFKLHNIDQKPGMENIQKKSIILDGSDISLLYYQKSFTVEFAALNFTDPQNTHYLCKLEGFDTDWHELGTERNATYTNLNPGKYIFYVKSVNVTGSWKTEPTILEIEILPAWWATMWFKIIIICLVLFLVWSFIYLRERRLKASQYLLEKTVNEKTSELLTKNNKLSELIITKDKFVSVLAHDIKNPVGSIKGLIRLLLDDYDNFKEEEIKNYLSMMSDRMENTYDLLENLLIWGRKASNTHVASELVEVDIKKVVDRTLALNSGNSKQITSENLCPDNLLVLADEDKLDFVIRNLIANSIKFCHKNGQIKVFTEKRDDLIWINIQDNGIGMTSEQLSNFKKNKKLISTIGTNGEKGTGLGLLNCNEFIESMGGKMFIESNENKGTTISFSLKGKMAY